MLQNAFTNKLFCLEIKHDWNKYYNENSICLLVISELTILFTLTKSSSLENCASLLLSQRCSMFVNILKECSDDLRMVWSYFSYAIKSQAEQTCLALTAVVRLKAKI